MHSSPLLTLTFALGLLASPAHAAIVIGNIEGATLGPANVTTTSSISVNGQSKAVSFTMATGQDWVLVDATLWTVGLDPNSGTTPDLPDVYIALDDSGAPGNRLSAFPNPVPTSTALQLTTWTSQDNTVLLGGETYWLVVAETIGDWNWVVDDVNDASGNPVSEISATFDGYAFKNADTAPGTAAPWGSSGLSNPVEITAIPHQIPEPSSVILIALGACCVFSRRKR